MVKVFYVNHLSTMQKKLQGMQLPLFTRCTFLDHRNAGPKTAKVNVALEAQRPTNHLRTSKENSTANLKPGQLLLYKHTIPQKH